MSLAAGGPGEEAAAQGDDEEGDDELQRAIGQLAELALLGSAQAGQLFPESLDELFEVVTLVQTQRLPAFPIILFGKNHWRGMFDWIASTLEPAGLISPGDLDLLRVTDDPAEAVKWIVDYRRTVGVPEQVPSAFR